MVKNVEIGIDSEGRKYWLLIQDPSKIYVKINQDEWGFYDHQNDLNLLLKSFNPKGSNEKALLENFNQFQYFFTLR